MRFIVCLRCRQPAEIISFSVKSTHEIVVVFHCGNCDVFADVELDLWELSEEVPPHGQYL